MADKALFRKAAVEKCQARWLGEIILVRPVSLRFLTTASIGMALVIVCFLVFGQYTKRSTVSGQLTPDVGVIKMYSSQPGIVVRKLVREGQTVKRGDVLYVISSERQSIAERGIQATVSHQVAQREQSIRDEIAHTRRLQQDDERALRKKIDSLQAEQANINRQIEGQKLRVQLAEAGLKRASKLLSQGFVSAEVAQQKEADLLDQQNRLQALERDRLGTERELQAQRSDLASLPLRQHNDIAQLERLLASANQEWTESEGKRSIAIVAPEDGLATAVVAEAGQAVDSSRPLAAIIPAGATLQAHFYAPSRAIGFIRPGDEVLLRFQAYPYQKFGHARGIVALVARTALPVNEVNAQPAAGNSEPVYLITVTLENQSIAAYGKSEPLQAGMLVDADILQEKRKLYEWVLDPLYSLSGKL